jgi:glycosyltransferase involved in cell wall biosynthesis
MDVTVLTSIYKSELYLKSFLQNLDSQIGIDSCELIFISTEASGFERKLLEEFTQVHPNAKLIYTKYPFGIYEAWNIGIEVSSSKYITNWNVDDQRSFDSIFHQFNFMEENQHVDIGYQDLFYVFSPNLSWEQIQNIGLKTRMASVSLPALMTGACPPHNGPIWRRELHDSVGLFDPQYRSAGDLDFWIRCALKDKKFLKMSKVHSSYFYNPEGMSTSSQSPGISEVSKIINSHMNAFIEKVERSNKELKRALETDFDNSFDTISFLNLARKRLENNG